jgi:membrane fusion protein (multidrug efflux system)
MSGPQWRRAIFWTSAAIVVVGVGVGAVLLARNAQGNGKKKGDAAVSPAAPVELALVQRGDITTFLETTTTLEARSSATLVAAAQGRLMEVGAEEGDWVRKGDVLARIDDTAARLAVERAEVAAQLAEREAERGRQMSERGFLSEKETDDLEWRRRNAAVALHEAQYGLAQTRLTAPFTGRVTARMVNLGETVTPGRDCFRVEEFNPLLARLYFPERELARVRPGQEAVLTLDALPGHTFGARVSLVNPVVDRANGTFKVTLEIRDPQGLLRPGNFARVRLRTGSHEDVLVLPQRAMISEDGESFVFVARGDTVVRVPVTLGAISGDTAQILSGLDAGDRVVTVGQGGLKQGSRIKPVKL